MGTWGSVLDDWIFLLEYIGIVVKEKHYINP